MPTEVTRRTFVGSATAAVCQSVRADQGVVGANERIRLGWIGCGGRGAYLAAAMRNMPGVEVVAVCDVYNPHAEKARTQLGSSCRSRGPISRTFWG